MCTFKTMNLFGSEHFFWAVKKFYTKFHPEVKLKWSYHNTKETKKTLKPSIKSKILLTTLIS